MYILPHVKIYSMFYIIGNIFWLLFIYLYLYNFPSKVIFQFAFISFVVLWSFSVGMVFLHNSLNTKGNDQRLQDKLLNKSDVQVVLSKGFNG